MDTDNITRQELKELFNSFNCLTPNDDNYFNELKRFFISYDHINQHCSTEIERPKHPELTVTEALAFFENFTSLYKNAVAQGVECNVWSVAKIGYDEVRTSAVLAWLLDPQGSHGQQTAFLEALAPILKEKNIEHSHLSFGGRVHVESLPLGELGSRVDIEIEGQKFLLFIEVKIYAGLQPKQLERYLDIAKHKAGCRPFAVVFLTPSGIQPDNPDLFQEIICLSWKDCAGAMREVVQVDDFPSQKIIKPIVLQFCEFISNF